MAALQVTVDKTGNFYLNTSNSPITITAAPGVTVTISAGTNGNIAGNSFYMLYQGQSETFTYYRATKIWLTGSTLPYHNTLPGLEGGTTGQYYHLTLALLNFITGLFGIKIYFGRWNLYKGTNQVIYGLGSFIQLYAFWDSNGKWLGNTIIQRAVDPNLNYFYVNMAENQSNVSIFLLCYGNSLPSPINNAINPPVPPT